VHCIDFGPEAWFYSADLSGQNLSGLDLAGANLEDSDLTGANLSGTNAAGANLAGATIADANIAETVLAGASLYVIRSGGGVTGSPASLPADWVLRSGWLIGPDVFLDNDNLGGVNLSGTDMAGAETSFTTFTGADLFGTNLNGDTWTDATCPDGTSASSHSGNCASALAFRFAGFSSPVPGSTVAESAKHVTVHFKLTTASGAAIPASIAAAIGTAKEVRVTLAGPGIKASRTPTRSPPPKSRTPPSRPRRASARPRTLRRSTSANRRAAAANPGRSAVPWTPHDCALTANEYSAVPHGWSAGAVDQVTVVEQQSRGSHRYVRLSLSRQRTLRTVSPSLLAAYFVITY
jgi:hypothetical protein